MISRFPTSLSRTLDISQVGATGREWNRFQFQWHNRRLQSLVSAATRKHDEQTNCDVFVRLSRGSVSLGVGNDAAVGVVGDE